MKKVLVLLFIFCNTNGKSQNRNNVILPKISNPLSVLNTAEGFTKLSNNIWVKRQNRIPVNFYTTSTNTGIDYEINKLGFDNFKSLQFRNVVIDNDTMLILLKSMTLGDYEYPSSRVGYFPLNRCFYWVINRDSFMNSVNFYDSLNEIKIISEINGVVEPTNLIRNLQESILNYSEHRSCNLIIKFKSYNKKVTDFLIYSYVINPYSNDWEYSFSGLVDKNIKYTSFNKEGIDFESFYFETSYSSFKNFITLKQNKVK